MDAVEAEIRRLLEQWPTMPTTVIAERIGWTRWVTVLKDRVRELRPLFAPPDPASRTEYRPGELAQCDLWFPPVDVPLGFGQVGRPPVLVMVLGRAAVAAARAAVDRSDPELWVPDDTDADASFRALLDAVFRAPSGSGWLTWQPFEDDDTIRTDMLMRATPYPHFPVGQDEPWIDAAVARVAMMDIPLRYVSYRPGPDLLSHVRPEIPFPMISLPPQGPANTSWSRPPGLV